MRPAVFLDRDGVLNLPVRIGGKTFPPKDAAAMEIAPGAARAVLALKAAGYLCICATNQPDIARGTRSLDNVAEMNRKVMSVVPLDDIYVCPHDDPDDCSCRKPKPGMLLAAAEKWDIDLSASWMVGDRPSDVLAGKAAGCRTILVAAGTVSDTNADHVCPDVLAAAGLICDDGLKS